MLLAHACSNSRCKRDTKCFESSETKYLPCVSQTGLWLNSNKVTTRDSFFRPLYLYNVRFHRTFDSCCNTHSAHQNNINMNRDRTHYNQLHHRRRDNRHNCRKSFLDPIWNGKNSLPHPFRPHSSHAHHTLFLFRCIDEVTCI